MADYAPYINPNDFLYQRKVYFTNPYNVFKGSLVVKLVLDSDNFNFDLSQTDGSDFRLVDGVATLRMWKAHWSKTDRHAVLFFKLQDVGGGVSVSYNAYWGNKTISANSEPETLGVLFYEDFNSSPLDSSKWEGDIANGVSTYGYFLKFGWGADNQFTTKVSPLQGKTSWTVEAGLYCNWDTNGGWDSTDYAMKFEFRGTENNMVVNVMHNNRIEHQIIQPGGDTYQYSDKTHGGLEGRSQNDVFISYYEPNDELEVRFLNRKTFGDVSRVIGRKVEGDTRPTKLRIGSYHWDDGAYPSYINWLIIRDYGDVTLSDLDGSELYIPYENILHQTQDYREYGPDITSTLYEHESSFGGDPYLLSNGIHDADLNVWVSDSDAVTESEIDLIIHTGWTTDNVVKRLFKHYDSGHEYYYNASKLSDLNLDRMGRDFWHCTTTSGWAAIKFPEPRTIGSFRVKFNEEVGAEPKNYIFSGSNFYPGAYINLSKELDNGTFDNVLDWQSRKVKISGQFKYYILDIKDTYGGENIRLQEWRMFDDLGNNKLVYPAQLRLHPATYGSYMDNFPKEIMFEGAIDGVNWVTLIPWVYTYTPYVEHYNGYEYWQRYSFNNTEGYWSFRLRCRGNWGASDGKIIIGEWAIHELEEEAYTYRILGGTSNNIQQIWAQEATGLEDMHNLFYVANEELNHVVNNKRVITKELPKFYEDFNVV